MKRLVPLLFTFAVLACDVPTDPYAFDQTFTGTIAAGDWTSHTVTAPSAGTLNAVLTWPSTNNDLDLYLTAASCTGYPPDDCDVLEISDNTTGDVESVMHTVTSGQQLKVWVDSFAEVSTSYTLRVTMF